MIKMGVSPAYFISKYGDDFSPSDVISSIPHLKDEGYNCFQIEIRYPDAVTYWDRFSIESLNHTCRDYGMYVSQFVCHHWMDHLSNSSQILMPFDIEFIERTLAIADQLPGCQQVTVPLAKGIVDFELDPVGFDRIQVTLIERLSFLLSKIKYHGKKMAIELQPGAFINGTDGYLQVCYLLGDDPDLCFNFDTGHANACKELVHLVPYKLGTRIIGTHLCDNLGLENHSWAPGDGTIAWSQLFKAMFQTGYQGAFDIEILCSSEQVEAEYRKAKQFIAFQMGVR